MSKLHKTYLDTRPISPEHLTSSADLRCTLTDTLKTLLQQTNHILITPSQATPNPESFLNNLKTHPKIYQASMSRQFAADLPPDIEQTALKDEPKDWLIKTADFGDDYDRVLQHRDGEYTQLLEDIARYDRIFQEGCGKIIILRPPTYSGYDILLTAAMQCLGYTKEQFQFIVIQPLKLYAFHKPSQKIRPIPDLPPNELIQAIGIDALRWHSFSTPLTETAPINISTAGQATRQDSLYRVQTAHAHCCTLLRQAHEQGIIQLNTPLGDYVWDNTQAITLANQIQVTPEVLQQSAREVAPHLLCQHLEAISNTCHQWFDSLTLNSQNCSLLLATKQSIFEVLQTILGINTLEPTKAK